MLLLPILLAACSPAADDSGDDTASVATIAVSGELAIFGAGMPLEGAEVCIHTQDGVSCDTTSSGGHWTISEVPGQALHDLTVEAADHFPARVDLLAGDEDLDVMGGLLPDVAVDVGANAVDVTLDPSKGHVMGYLLGQDAMPDETPVPGYTATMSGGGGAGPFYVGDAGVISADATETDATGFFFVFNVEPGTWDATVGKDGVACRPHAWLGVAGDGDGTVQATVVADTMTYVVVVCAE